MSKPFIIPMAIVFAMILQTDVRSQPIVANHYCTDLSNIPPQWIDSARSKLHIGYGHTSHGSQLNTGMNALFDFYGDKYKFNPDGSEGALDLEEGSGYDSGWLELDCGYSGWDTETRDYLNDTSHSDVNIIIWSWCGQAAGFSEEDMNNNYLNLMNQLEIDYPNVKFVYMTCHLDGSGADGNLNQRNTQIRNYCTANNKTLFDFADIESYDPDGLVDFMELNATDACDYDSIGATVNWALRWMAAHPGSEISQAAALICQDCCAHSQGLNCVLKARAIWWLWARLAGWNGSAGAGTSTVIPRTSTVRQNYPNPFNPSTTIEFTLLTDCKVTLIIYNILGHEVATLIDGERKGEGVHKIGFDASRLSSGVYFYRLTAGEFVESKKLILLK
jgi:hypothetical protein